MPNYEAIKWAKALIDELCWDAAQYDAYEMMCAVAGSVVDICRSSEPIRHKIALLTVLEQGSFSSWRFMMPATSVCCDAFKSVEKRFKKRRSILTSSYTEYTYFDEVEETTVFFDIMRMHVSSEHVSSYFVCDEELPFL